MLKSGWQAYFAQLEDRVASWLRQVKLVLSAVTVVQVPEYRQWPEVLSLRAFRLEGQGGRRALILYIPTALISLAPRASP